jgi:hypothetical protein
MDKAVAILFLFWSTFAFGQFDPAGGEEGSFGIPSNSPFIVSWGDSIQVERVGRMPRTPLLEKQIKDFLLKPLEHLITAQ